MKIKIAILGSTGSIGKSTLDIIKRNKSKFIIELLSAKRNYKELAKQANFFNAKNVLIYNKKYYPKIQTKYLKLIKGDRIDCSRDSNNHS